MIVPRMPGRVGITGAGMADEQVSKATTMNPERSFVISKLILPCLQAAATGSLDMQSLGSRFAQTRSGLTQIPGIVRWARIYLRVASRSARRLDVLLPRSTRTWGARVTSAAKITHNVVAPIGIEWMAQLSSA